MAKATKPQSGYMGPEAAPFKCGHCVHFDGKASCELVDGKIEAAGCCNLFSPGAKNTSEAIGDYYAKGKR